MADNDDGENNESQPRSSGDDDSDRDEAGVPTQAGTTLPRAEASGVIRFGDEQAECYVLSDDRRVLSTSQVQAFFGASKNRHFGRMIARIPGVSKDLAVRPSIAFRLPNGGVANGYEGLTVMAICFAYQAAFLAGKLHHAQMDIAKRAMEMVCVYAQVGIEAAIDEATGYQKRRPGDYVASRVEQFLREYRDEWKPRWTEDHVVVFCRLYKRAYVPNPKFMQGVAGKIYDILMGSDVMAELRKRNPQPSKGTNHHQFFCDAVQRRLERELDVIAALAKTSNSRSRFWHRMEVHYLGKPFQTDWLDA